MRPTRHERSALRYLMLGSTEPLAAMPGVGKPTMDALVRKGWAVPHHDEYYGRDGYRITDEGTRILAQSSGTIRR